jgi:hypothetical protein
MLLPVCTHIEHMTIVAFEVHLPCVCTDAVNHFVHASMQAVEMMQQTSCCASHL